MSALGASGFFGLLVTYALFAYLIVTAGQVLTWAHWQLAVYRASMLDDAIGKQPKWLLSAGGAGAGVAFFAVGEGGHSVSVAMLAVVLAVVVATDLRLRRIYDLNLLAATLSIAAVAIASSEWIEAALGASLAVASYVLIGAVLRMAQGRRVFADGDYKLGAVIGLALGPVGGPMAVALAVAIGAIVALVRRDERGREIAFAPYLTGGAVLAGAAVRLSVFGGPL